MEKRGVGWEAGDQSGSSDMEEVQCFGHKSKSLDETLRPSSSHKQKVKPIGFDEAATELDAEDTAQLEELQLKEAGKVSSSVRIHATHSKAHGKETCMDFLSGSNHSTLNQAHGKEANAASSPDRNHAIHCNVHDNELASNQGALYKGTARSRLYEICAANYWNPPSFVCCKDEGPSNSKLFTYKVTIKVEGATTMVLECFGEPRAKKKDAAEHAAEGALWYLQHLGYLSKAQ